MHWSASAGIKGNFDFGLNINLHEKAKYHTLTAFTKDDLVVGCCGCNAGAANNKAHACIHNFGEIYEFILELIDVLCEHFLIEMRVRFQSH